MDVRCITATLISTATFLLLHADQVGALNECLKCVKPDEFKSYPQTEWTEAYALIDKHLRKKIKSNDLSRNLDEVRKVLRQEQVIHKDWRLCGLQWKSGLSRRLQCPGSPVVNFIDATSKLLELRFREQLSDQCIVETALVLAHNNRIAIDPIGRRVRGEPDLLPRVDNLIFDAALKSANFCLPLYRNQLTIMSLRSHDDFNAMEIYWNHILERRLIRAHLADETDRLDTVLAMHPDGTLDFIRQMPHAIEVDEVPFVSKMLDKDDSITGEPADLADLRAYKLVKLLKEPCERYFELVADVMRSINFYLRLRKFLSKELIGMIVYDEEVSRLRAYSLMCKKLVEDEDHFVRIQEAVRRHQ